MPTEPYPGTLQVQWAPSARTLWHALYADQPLPASLLTGSINAGHVPGSGQHHGQPGSDAYGLCT